MFFNGYNVYLDQLFMVNSGYCETYSSILGRYPVTKRSCGFTPPRQVLYDGNGQVMAANPASPVPFSQETFNEIVETEHFHKGFFKKERIGEVSRLRLADVTSKCGKREFLA